MATYSSVTAWEAAQGGATIASAPATLNPTDSSVPAYWTANPPKDPITLNANSVNWNNQPVAIPPDGVPLVANQIIIT